MVPSAVCSCSLFANMVRLAQIDQRRDYRLVNNHNQARVAASIDGGTYAPGGWAEIWSNVDDRNQARAAAKVEHSTKASDRI